jgi:hypothetical protein
LISSLAIHSKVETGEGKSESGYHQIVVTLAMQEEERIPSLPSPHPFLKECLGGNVFNCLCIFYVLLYMRHISQERNLPLEIPVVLEIIEDKRLKNYFTLN